MRKVLAGALSVLALIALLPGDARACAESEEVALTPEREAFYQASLTNAREELKTAQKEAEQARQEFRSRKSSAARENLQWRQAIVDDLKDAIARIEQTLRSRRELVLRNPPGRTRGQVVARGGC